MSEFTKRAIHGREEGTQAGNTLPSKGSKCNIDE